jgi:hypothetical protein
MRYLFVLMLVGWYPVVCMSEGYIAKDVREYREIIRAAEAVIKKFNRKIEQAQQRCPHPLERQILFPSLPGLSSQYDIRCDDCGLERPGWLPRKQIVPKSINHPHGFRDTTPEEDADMKRYLDSIIRAKEK